MTSDDKGEPKICISLMCEWDMHNGPCSDGVDRSEQLHQFAEVPKVEPAWVGEIRVLAQSEPVKLQHRLDRIAEAHQKHVFEGGLTSGECIECGEPHPCPTYVWATTDRDALAPWDPTDDEETQG